MPFAAKPVSTLSKLKQRGMPWDNLKDFEMREEHVQIKQGKVKVLRAGDLDQRLALILAWSEGSSNHQVPAFLYSGYQVLIIVTESPFKGHKFSTRSEDILKPGGLAEFVN